MIDVRELIKRYSVEELNKQAEYYYNSVDRAALSQKPFRMAEIKHLLTEVSHLSYGLELKPGDVVLDFGCGPGWTSKILASCGCNVIGIDVSRTGLEIARANAEAWRSVYPTTSEGSVEFRLFDGRTLPIESQTVDKVFVLDAFHHVPDQEPVLREFARVLRPGGIAGFCEPGPHHSKHPDSQREMSMFKVIENDIVLSDINSIALSCGFRELVVSLNPLFPKLVPFDSYSRFPKETDILEQYIQFTDNRIKNYPIFFLYKEGSAILDSRAVDQLAGLIELRSEHSIVVSEGEKFSIDLRVVNTGSALWLPSGSPVGSVGIGGLISGESINRPYRSHLSSVRVLPGQVIEVSALFEIPLSKGKYEITLDLVAEYVSWFKSLGGNELLVRFEVT